MKKLWNLAMTVMGFIARIFALCDGVEHLVGAGFSFWGIYKGHIHDWKVWASPTLDLATGLMGIAVTIFLHYRLKKKG